MSTVKEESSVGAAPRERLSCTTYFDALMFCYCKPTLDNPIQAADEFAVIWANQHVLESLHTGIPIVSRHRVSCISTRLFVGIGKWDLLPSKNTHHLLLQTWLQPLINDYSWLQHGCRSFDKKVVEEEIGRTILTLPLEDQQSILLAWLDSFLKTGDNCPNLQRAFEVWWQRSFIRPHVERSRW